MRRSLGRFSLLGVVLSCGAWWLAAGCGDNTTERPPMTVPVGSACGGDVRCADDLSCVQDGRLPGGYCSRICSDATCPSGSECTTLYGSPLCLSACGDGSFVRVALSVLPSELRLRMENDGKSAEASAPSVGGGRGVANLRTRAEELGGELRVDVGDVTQLELRVPLPLRVQHGSAALRALP